MDKIRCPNCRGMKQVAKLGGMMGDCNLCLGTGSVTEKPKPVIVEAVEPVNDIVKRVADCVPTTTLELKEDEGLPTDKQLAEIQAIQEGKETQIKVDPKRAIYKRKKA